MPFNVHNIKYCVPESSSVVVASRYSFESESAVENKVYSFSMRWRDHLGSSENEYIEDESGTENTNNSQKNCYLYDIPVSGSDIFEAPLSSNPVVYIEYTGQSGQDLRKMKVIKGRSYGCILDYSFDSCEIEGSSVYRDWEQIGRAHV